MFKINYFLLRRYVTVKGAIMVWQLMNSYSVYVRKNIDRGGVKYVYLNVWYH